MDKSLILILALATPLSGQVLAVASLGSNANQASTPGFSPGGGSYFGTQTVTIASITSGVTICYTTDGTTPAATTPGTCSHGTTLANGGTVSVASSETIEALATKTALTNSYVGTAVYTISTNPLIASGCAAGVNGGTVSGLNTTGANLIVVSSSGVAGPSPISDNKSNGTPGGAIRITSVSPYNSLFYWSAPTVGTGHNFTLSSSSSFAGFCVYAFNYGGAGILDSGVTNSNVTSGTTTCQAGSITPSGSNKLIIAGTFLAQNNTTPSIDSGYTLSAFQQGVLSTNYSSGAAWLFQSSGTATNPTWTGTASGNQQCVIASFH